jgi:predicted transcriptional regulator
MVRVGIKEDAEFCGGINIFGSSYGNYEQDIVFKFEIDK